MTEHLELIWGGGGQGNENQQQNQKNQPLNSELLPLYELI